MSFDRFVSNNKIQQMPSLIINEKRTIYFGKLLVIAGPSCSGKSQLIAKLQSGKHENVFKEVNFNAKEPPAYLSLSSIRTLDQEYYPAVVLHLDILRLNNFHSYISEMLTNGRNDVVVITLCVRQKAIVYRLCKRTLWKLFDNIVNGRGRKSALEKFRVKWKFFKNVKALHQCYDTWFQLLEDRSIVENYVLDVNRDEIQKPRVYSKSLFQSLIGFKV